MTHQVTEQVTTDTEDMSDQGKPPGRRRRRLRRVGLWLVLSFALVGAALAVVGWAFLGRPIAAPDWIKAEIETRIEQQLPGIDLRFSELSFFVTRELRPDIALSNVELIDRANGRRLIEFVRADISIARRSLFERKIMPKTVSVSGVFLKLRRDADGSFDISFGSGLGADNLDMVGAMAELDRVVQSPGLQALDSVEINAVTLDYQDARSGRAWTVDGGRLSLGRVQDFLRLRGDFALLSGRSYAATLEVNAESQIGSSELRVGVNVADIASGDIASQSPALAWLGVLRAPISGALRAVFDGAGGLGPLHATLQIGEGVLQPTDASRPVPFTSAKTYFTYDPADTSLRFDEISLESDWIRATGEGHARLEDLENGLPQALLGQVSLTGISTNPASIYETPRAINAATLDFHMGLSPFIMRIGQLTLQDEGDPVHLSGRVTANRDGWGMSVLAHIDEIAPDRMLGYWPGQLIPGTRNWISNNVLGGRMRNVSLALTAEPGTKPDVYLGAELAEAEVRFLKTMPPVREARGVLQLEQNRLIIAVDQGHVVAGDAGQVDVAGTVFSVPDVTIKEGPAQVALRTEGPIPASLWLLDQEPINAMKKAGRSIDLAQGRMRTDGMINFRMKKKQPPDAITFDFAGKLLDVTSDDLVPGKQLSATELSFSADNDSLRIFGPGALEGVPFDGAWQTALGASNTGAGGKVEAKVTLSNAFLDALNIDLPPGSVSGQGSGILALDLKKGVNPRFTLTSNLAGLGLRIDALGWTKARNATGKLEITGTLGTPVSIDNISLQASGLRMNGRLSLRPGGGLNTFRIERLVAGSWLDAPVTLTGQGRNAPPIVQVSGGRIDLRSAPFSASGGGSGGGDGSPLRLAPDRLQISDGISLTNFRGDFTTRGGLKGAFTARLNGGTELDGKVSPGRNGSSFVIRSSKAGGILRDAGLIKNVYGGRLTLRLKPTGAPGTFDGELGIDKTSIRNAPVMAELLSAISVVGLLEQLGGQGIGFSEVEARFRMTPKQVILTRSSAVGPSMGISLDGYYDLESGTMDMQGVLSPIYMVNFVGQLFSRKGEGLIGFNFNLKGKSDNPRILVNPLSALTPGLFREIFRRPPPKVTQ